MRNILLLLPLICFAACDHAPAVDLLHYIIVDEAEDAANDFLLDYPDCVTWNWTNTTEVSAFTSWVASKIAYEYVYGEDPQTPGMTWLLGTADCKDLAIFQAALLRYLGYTGLLQLFDGEYNGTLHVWLEIYPNGDSSGHLLDREVTWVLESYQQRDVFGYHDLSFINVP